MSAIVCPREARAPAGLVNKLQAQALLRIHNLDGLPNLAPGPRATGAGCGIGLTVTMHTMHTMHTIRLTMRIQDDSTE